MGQNLVIDGSACVKNVEQNNDEREAEVLNAGRNAWLKASTEMRAEDGTEATSTLARINNRGASNRVVNERRGSNDL